MSTVYARRNNDGHITTISCNSSDAVDASWSVLPSESPEVLEFIEELVGIDKSLLNSDLSFVRVLEDVIELLIDHSVIRFTDLPLPAQTKLLQRRSNRKRHQGLQLLETDDEALI